MQVGLQSKAPYRKKNKINQSRVALIRCVELCVKLLLESTMCSPTMAQYVPVVQLHILKVDHNVVKCTHGTMG